MMAPLYFMVSFFICAIIGYSSGAEYMEIKDDFIKTCQRKDKSFLACSTESTQNLYTKLATGINGLEDLSFDPMKLNKVQILSDDGPVSINTTLSKAVVSGFSKIIVVESDVSPINYNWITKIYIPKIRIEGNYQMKGRILVLPLNGHGKCWFEPHDMEMTIYTKTHLYEKFNHIFYNITGVSVDFKISGLKLRMNNLFDGIKALEDSTNEYLNQNWKPVSESLRPIITKSIEDNFLLTLNKIFNFIPADYFVSDIPHPSELYGTS